MQFTIHTQDYETYELCAADGSQTIKVDASHRKFELVRKALLASENRVIKINNQGRWTSAKDYDKVYDLLPGTTPNASTAPQAQPANIEVKLEKLDDLDIDDSLFESMNTGTVFDKFMSSEGGVQRGTNVMAAGAPGIGKCVRHNTLIKVRNKRTGELRELTIKEFHDLL